jgi:3-oxoacyl-[acyl-carrier protein] reductase
MSNKTILIVGASSEIGCQLIRELATSDTTILAHYYSGREALDAVAVGLPGTLVPLQADLRSEAGIDGLIAAVEARGDGPDQIVLLAAPRMTMLRFKDLSWEDFKHHSDMQLCSAVKICGRFLPRMAKAKSGNIVFVLSSVTLGLPPASMAHYVTGKYAMLGLMRALASEYAGKQVKINAVSPSMIETQFLSEIPEKIVEFSAEQHPFKRNASIGEVAPAIKFLLSDGAGYMTGVNLPITGGTQV